MITNTAFARSRIYRKTADNDIAALYILKIIIKKGDGKSIYETKSFRYWHTYNHHKQALMHELAAANINS